MLLCLNVAAPAWEYRRKQSGSRHMVGHRTAKGLTRGGIKSNAAAVIVGAGASVWTGCRRGEVEVAHILELGKGIWISLVRHDSAVKICCPAPLVGSVVEQRCGRVSQRRVGAGRRCCCLRGKARWAGTVILRRRSGGRYVLAVARHNGEVQQHCYQRYHAQVSRHAGEDCKGGVVWATCQYAR